MAHENNSTVIHGCIDRLRVGDESARVALLDCAADRLTRLARKMLKGYPGVARWEQTDDVAQNALVRLDRALRAVTPPTARFLPPGRRPGATRVNRSGPALPGPTRARGAPRHSAGRGDSADGQATAAAAPDTTYDPGRLAAWAEFHAAVGSSARPPSPHGCNIPAPCPSTAWAGTRTVPSTPCRLSRARPSRKPSTPFTGMWPRDANPAGEAWRFADCSSGSSRSAIRWPTRHDQGVIHRDLKPSNIMLGTYGETLVMDWGLAKRIGTDDASVEVDRDAPSPSPSPETLTVTGAVLGTLYYMSPEQARGEPTSPASDVFSLGLILYAILTGESPYANAVPRGGDLHKAVREAAVVPPRRRDPGLPGALEAICLKALAARPEDRYSSPRGLADDLSKWLADEPVGAYRDPLAERARRWVKRNRTAVTGAAVALLASVIGLGAVAFILANSNRRERALRAAAVGDRDRA